MTEWQDGDTLERYVTRRIEAIFDDVAELAGKIEMPEAQAAGLPMALFAADRYMVRCWQDWVARMEGDDRLRGLGDGVGGIAAAIHECYRAAGGPENEQEDERESA